MYMIRGQFSSSEWRFLWLWVSNSLLWFFFTYTPTSKLVLLEKKCLKWEAVVCPNKRTDLPILHFSNLWHNGFLGKYNLHCFNSILCPQQRAIFRYMCKIDLKNRFISKPCSPFPHQNSWLQPGSYESRENLLQDRHRNLRVLGRVWIKLS